MKISKRHIVPLLLFLVIATMSLGSCEEGPSDLVISEGQMEDVLYDYHIADGIIHMNNLDSATAIEYIEAVYRKHGIDQATFDSSMVYYMRHADKMQGIYNRLSTRMENEGRMQGIDGGNMASTNASADTCNIWNIEKTKVFTTEAPYNSMRFEFKADSTFKAGDKFMLSFNADFIYQEGMRNGFAILSMTLANDSVINQTTSISSSMSRTLQVEDTKRIGVKKVKGYFMHRPSNIATERNSSTVKMMIISNIALIKMHVQEQIQDSININNNEKTDSTGPGPRPMPMSQQPPEPGMH